jgi:K(+)-stimulated pyrophosphate-energized sodium pump
MKMEFFEDARHFVDESFYATIVGLVVGAVISSVTEYYTGLGTKPVMAIVQKSSTGAGTNVIAGLATGMISTFPTVLLFAAIWTSYLQDFMGSISRFSYDGDDRNALAIDALDQYLIMQVELR